VSPLLPFPLHPDPNGLFPWGAAEDWWNFYWLKQGEPSEWGIVATFKWIEEYYLFSHKQMTEFLLDLVRHPFTESLRLGGDEGLEFFSKK
jgi:hypothetical protein